MDTSRLYVGIRVNSYKILCELLRVKPKSGGCSKKAHLKEMECYFKYHKEGNTFVIDEIYTQPLERTENRGGHNAIFKDSMLQDMLKMIIFQSENNYEIAIPKHLLHSQLGLVNKYYDYYRKNPKELVEMNKELDLEQTEYFFDGVNRTVENVVKRDLDRIAKEGVITWKESRAKVVKRQKDGELVHYLCSSKEVENILTVERQLCKKYGYKNTNAVKLLPYHLKTKFYDEVQKILNDEYKMYYTYSYKVYHIVFTKSQIQADLEQRGLTYTHIQEKSEQVKLVMVNAVENRIVKRYEKFQQKNIGYKDYVQNFTGVGVPKTQENTEYKLNDKDEMVAKDSFFNNMRFLIERCMLDVVIDEVDNKLAPNRSIIITSKVASASPLTEENNALLEDYDVLMYQMNKLVQKGETEEAYNLFAQNEDLRQQFEQLMEQQSA